MAEAAIKRPCDQDVLLVQRVARDTGSKLLEATMEYK